MQRIHNSIKRQLENLSHTIVFDYLNRTRNAAGRTLENLTRKYKLHMREKSGQ